MKSWKRVADPANAALIERAADVKPGDLRGIARLRKHGDAELVRIAIELASARRKAAVKMPGRASTLVADPAGVEMASSSAVAAWKAARFARCARPDRVLDLCCGIGGDAIELTEAGLRVVAVDQDETRAWMCAENAACETRAAAMASVGVDAADLVHVDPSRRDGAGRRRSRMTDMTPPPEAVAAVIAEAGGGCVKLAPGWDPFELLVFGGDPRRPSEAEWISERGSLMQGLLWTGSLAEASGTHRATRIGPGGAETIRGERGFPRVVASVDAIVYTPDPALERAKLVHVLAERHSLAALGHEYAGLLTGDGPPAAACHDGWLTAFRVCDRMTWSEKAVRAWLRGNDGGHVTVKTRGGVVDPDPLQKRLRGAGSTSYVVFVQRLGSQIEALVTQRFT